MRMKFHKKCNKYKQTLNPSTFVKASLSEGSNSNTSWTKWKINMQLVVLPGHKRKQMSTLNLLLHSLQDFHLFILLLCLRLKKYRNHGRNANQFYQLLYWIVLITLAITAVPVIIDTKKYFSLSLSLPNLIFLFSLFFRLRWTKQNVP